jgi:hypothetical protein
MRYATKQDVIEQAVRPALDSDDYDVHAIADEAFTWKVDRDEHGNELLNTAGFEQTVTEDEFWVIVERHDHSLTEAALTDAGRVEPGPIDSTAILAKPIDSLLNSGAPGDYDIGERHASNLDRWNANH